MEILTVNACDPERAPFITIDEALDVVVGKAPKEWSSHIAKLKELVAYLQSAESRELYHGFIFPVPPFALTLLGRHRGTNVEIWVDFYDKANVDEETATLHYRVQIHRDGSKLARDVRTSDPSVVARQIRITLGPGLRNG